MNQRFFSIIIPAHNEEKIIEQNLSCLKKLDYPKYKYEVIVVENGSTDLTYEKAKKYEAENFKIYSMEGKRGVSKARNFGVNKIFEKTDWCVIMDADAFLKESFLKELNSYLDTHQDVVYGTTKLLFDVNTLNSRFWAWYRNYTDKLMKTLHIIHIVRVDLAKKEKYDESLAATEDLKYGKALSKYGKYFFMETDSVISSSRRFEQRGYWGMFFINIGYGIMPRSFLKKIGWEVIR
jgi:glycosyltransferase involved in cell wall biosynthesis